MDNSITIRKPEQDIIAEIKLPLSKSILNRLLVLKFSGLHDFQIEERNLPSDVMLMSGYLKTINDCLETNTPLVVDTQNSGTVARFLTALLANTTGKWLITGTERMKSRPIDPLVNALRQIDGEIHYKGKPGYLPVYIHGKKLTGGKTKVLSLDSSQYVSALMLIAPFLEQGLRINVDERMKINPYVNLTIDLLRHFGINVKKEKYSIIIEHGALIEKSCEVEPDWSSAAFWYEITALSNNADISLSGLRRNSSQGDSILPELFKKLGVETSNINDGIRLKNSGRSVQKINMNFKNNPDIALPVIVACAAKNIRGQFTGLKNLQIKESNRLHVLIDELTRLGMKLELKRDYSLDLYPGKIKSKYTLNTYNDHRVAMSFAPLSLVMSEIVINNPQVVKKSYPDFWKDLKKAGFKIA